MARSLDESEIIRKPPYYRDIFFYLLRKAVWKDCTRRGYKLKRGEILTSYKEISGDLYWVVGARTDRYQNWQIHRAFKYLTKAHMIVTRKTTRGSIVSIVNYDKYQKPGAYDRNHDSNTKDHRLSIIEELISNKYGEIPFPKKFPVEKFAVWEFERRKNNSAPKMTETMRKTALTHILNAGKRKEAFIGIGYNTITELLEHAAENRWRGFSWLKQKLNQWETRQKQYQDRKETDNRPDIPTFDQLEQFKGKKK